MRSHDDKEYDEDEIIGQSLSAGSEVKKGDKITLYIPNIVETLPNFAGEGWSLVDAQNFCNEHNIAVTVTEQESAGAPGIVISQSRKAGSNLENVSTITLTVSVAIKQKPAETPTDPNENNGNNNNSQNQNQNQTP